MKIEICSQNENLVVFDDKQLHLKCTFTVLDVEKTTFFKVYPLGDNKKYIPFAFSIKFEQEKVICNSQFVKQTIYPNFLKLELCPPQIFENAMPNIVNSLTVLNGKNESFEVSIFNSIKNNLSIKSKSTFFYDSLFGFNESNISKIGDFVLITYSSENSYYLYVFSLNENICKLHCEVEQFEVHEGVQKLIILKKLCDSLCHGKIVEISLKNDFEILKTNLTYLDENVNISSKEIAFFDCIKAGNFKKAQEFITVELNSIVSTDALEEYFKDFDDIEQSPVDFSFYLIKKGCPTYANKIEFEYKENLINNLKILYNS